MKLILSKNKNVIKIKHSLYAKNEENAIYSHITYKR